MTEYIGTLSRVIKTIFKKGKRNSKTEKYKIQNEKLTG